MFLRRKDHKTLSDLELIAESRKGNKQAVGVLFDRYAHLLLGVGLKYTKDKERSKDLVMDLFEELEVLIKKHEIRNFKSWLHTCMRNKCLIALRQEKKMKKLEIKDEILEQEVDSKELKEAELENLEQAIERLKEGQKECIKLFYLQRNSYERVAELTGLSVAQVRSNLQNGRRNLRIRLSEHADQNG